LWNVRQLFDEGSIAGFSDTQLLERFTTRRDAEAFEALVERHGPMVLAVCRSLLKDGNDAQDAFQATFLVLVRKADSLWVVRSSLGSWLYRVAYRIAVQANVDAVRRREVERRVGAMREPISVGEGSTHDILSVLHDEIGRLPEKLRAPIVLCHLEQMTHAEAADQLGWTVGTVRGRVARARQLLGARLSRRGLELSGGLLITILSEQMAQAAVPKAWASSTAGIATKLVAGQAVAGVASATASAFSKRLLRSMVMTRLKWATAALLVAGVATGAAATLAPPRTDERAMEPIPRLALGDVPAKREIKPDDRTENAKRISISGRVFDPDGQPKAGATIYVRHFHFYGRGEEGRAVELLATTGPDGRFRFELDTTKSDESAGDQPSWHRALITAVAPGLGPAWILAGDAARAEPELRFVRDDRPIRGRVLDSQGHPVAKATVRVACLALPHPGVNLDELLALGKFDWDGMHFFECETPTWIGRDGAVTTDADGRFQIQGVGVDRIARLSIEAQGLERAVIAVLDRMPKNAGRPRPRPRATQLDMIYQDLDLALYGQTFDHVVGPSKSITGVVRVKGTDQPVAGVTVAGQILGRPWTTIMVSTDKDGRYRIDGLPKSDSYDLDVRTKPGWPHLRVPRRSVGDTEGLKPIDVSFEVTPGVAVRGRLVDKRTGHPVACDWVQYMPLPSNRFQKNDVQGSYSRADQTWRITVPPGEGLIAVRVAGKSHPYRSARLGPADKGKLAVQGEAGSMTGFLLAIFHAYRLVNFPEGTESATLDLEAAPGISRKGEVMGPSGQAVAGASALGLFTDRYTSSSLEGASFEVLGLQSGEARLVEIRHEGFGLAGSLMVDGSAKGDQPLVVRLQRCGAITGRLVDDDGLPLNRAELVAEFVKRPYGVLDPVFMPRKAVTDANGRFRLEGINPALAVLVGIQDPNHPAPKFEAKPQKDLSNVTVKPGEVLELGEVRVRFDP